MTPWWPLGNPGFAANTRQHVGIHCVSRCTDTLAVPIGRQIPNERSHTANTGIRVGGSDLTLPATCNVAVMMRWWIIPRSHTAQDTIRYHTAQDTKEHPRVHACIMQPSCTYHVRIMHASTMHHACIIHASCMHHARAMHTKHASCVQYGCIIMRVSCAHHARIMHAPCMHHACGMHASCMYHACKPMTAAKTLRIHADLRR